MAIALLVSCGNPEGFEPPEVAAGAAEEGTTEELASSTQAIVSGPEHYWESGWLPVPLVPDEGNFCFLTGITGKFEDYSDDAAVYRSGGYWYLGGAGPHWKAVRARCAHTGTPNWSYGVTAWNFFVVTRYMDRTDEFTCALTSVGGFFTGPNTSVSLGQSCTSAGCYWTLTAMQKTSLWGNYTLQAQANCTYAWAFGQPGPEVRWTQWDWTARALGPEAGRSCFLTYMQGHFEGGGEYVEIFPSGGHWYLGGGSMQDAVVGGARCVPP